MNSEQTTGRRFIPLGLILWCATIATLLVGSPTQACLDVQDDQHDFFESRIRPVLIEHCYACHNSVAQSEADYALDWRTGIRTKTEHGTGVIPGDSANSLLLKVIEHQVEGLEMPDGGAKLSPEVIADFKKWISDGAVDPRNEPPSETELNSATSWESTLASRKKWWSFQPVRDSDPPPANDWSDHPIDRFIFASASSKNLQPSASAEPRVLMRRLAFAMNGIPPTKQQLHALESGEKSFEQTIDELLDSARFGERWARHWMDLVRYADSHGSEGDPDIPNVYQYRDYLIRAFNDDVPYDQLAREHIAGDLLKNPRINQKLGINESAIGPAHWRLCFHGFAPTDALDEKVRFTDDQINVFSKTFLGLTVSCARCHNHKFDAISQSDYYALFGIVGSCRPAMVDVNLPEKQTRYQVELTDLKSQIKTELAAFWLAESQTIAKRLTDESDSTIELLKNANSPTHPLNVWKTVLDQVEQGIDFETAWSEQLSRWKTRQSDVANSIESNSQFWDLTTSDGIGEWFGDGNAPLEPVSAGGFSIAESGDQVIGAIVPASVFTNQLSNRHRAVLGSPRFRVDEKMTAWIRCIGEGQSTVRYVVQNYPRSGTVYPINEINNRNWHWQQFDLEYWAGDEVHLEIATAMDAPLEVRKSDRSWFGIREVIVRKTELGPPKNLELDYLTLLFETCIAMSPNSMTKLAACYESAICLAIEAWMDGKATDEQAIFLDALIRDSVLSNSLQSTPKLRELMAQYRETELQIPLPFRVPGITEADAHDQPLFERGDHRQPLEPVGRRFLEAIDATPYQTKQSGRLQLANDLFRGDNPFTSRVIVNRIWLNLFGRGLVATPDNFGRMGAKPSHPELLDFLATRMVEQGWSIKKMIRFIVTSKTWQQASLPSQNAIENDPENNLLSHFSFQRLDAESIRDSLISLSGQRSDEMFGPGFAANSTIGRRAVYVRSKRNDLDLFLVAFDSPVPFATTGLRNTTNVPAQSLTLLNSSFVIELANRWAIDVRNNMPSADPPQRIESMFESALGRVPTQTELEMLVSYYQSVSGLARDRATERQQLTNSIANLNSEIRETIDPVRRRLIESISDSSEAPIAPSAIAHWDFSHGTTDTIGNLKLQLKSNAKVENGALILDGKGFALSEPLTRTIGPRTLEAWVQLDDLKQTGGGVVTIQTGNEFDSIVFAELKQERWLAGSDFHRRTLPFEGPADNEVVKFKSHLAISYAQDGTITGYRNGEPYGRPIRKSDLHQYPKQKSQIVLGMRHGTESTPGRMLNGRIFEVRIYDRALSANEVAASFAGQPLISEAEVLAELEPDQLDRLNKSREQLAMHELKLESLESYPGPNDPLARVAHAIFNLKEFIYVR